MSPSLQANLILVVHSLFILGVIIPVPLILIGGRLKWRFVRNFWFRFTHLLMIAFVVAESQLKIACPLTVWENTLRDRAGQEGNGESFIAYWLHQLFFYQAPPWVFAMVYVGFGLLVVGLLIAYPPRKPIRTP